jgi:hypothetical protein
MKNAVAILFIMLLCANTHITKASISSKEYLTIEWMTENADTIIIGKVQYTDLEPTSLRVVVEVQSYIKSKPIKNDLIIFSDVEALSWHPEKGETCVFYLNNDQGYHVLSCGAGIFPLTSENYPISKSMSLLNIDTLNKMQVKPSTPQASIILLVIGAALYISRLAVHNDYRDMHNGISIMEFCLGFATYLSNYVGCRYLVLYTDEKLSTYYEEKCGFKLIEKVDETYWMFRRITHKDLKKYNKDKEFLDLLSSLDD